MENIFFEEFKRHSFTKKQLLIAQYFMDQQYNIVDKSLRKASEEAGVSEVAMLSFVRKIGYAGFADMKEHVLERMHREATANKLSQRQLTDIMLDSDRRVSQGDDLFAKYEEQAVQNIVSSLQSNSARDYEQAVNHLTGAQAVMVMGMRGAVSVAEHASLGLNYIVDHVVCLRSSYTSAIQELSLAGEHDVLLLICLSRFYKSDLTICRMAKERGMKIILISNNIASPISNYADVVLSVEVQSISFYNSLPGVFAVVEYLLSMAIQQNRDRIEDRMQVIDRYTQDYLL